MARHKWQQDDLEREQEAVHIDPADASSFMPAARCRECLTLTWRVSLTQGLRDVTHPQHKLGCSWPEGRFDKMHREGRLHLLHMKLEDDIEKAAGRD